MTRNQDANTPAEGRRAPRTGLILWIAAVVCALFALGFHLHVKFEVVRLGYETSQAKARLHGLRLREKALRLEIATLKAPVRVEREARERLGMDVADASRIRYLDPGGAAAQPTSGKVR